MDEESLNLEASLSTSQLSFNDDNKVIRAPSMSPITPRSQTRGYITSGTSEGGFHTSPLSLNIKKSISIKEEPDEVTNLFYSSPRSPIRNSMASELSNGFPKVENSHSQESTQGSSFTVDLSTQNSESTMANEDDDICFIEPAAASKAAQRKWARSVTRVPPIFINTSISAIKQEPGIRESPIEAPQYSPIPELDTFGNRPMSNNVLNLLTRNRESMRKKMMAAHEISAAGSDPPGSQKPGEDGVSGDELSQIDQAMKDASDEDHSWMEEEIERNNEYEEKKILHEELKTRRNNGKITENEMTMLFKLEKQLVSSPFDDSIFEVSTH